MLTTTRSTTAAWSPALLLSLAPTPAPSDPSQATGDQDELAATQLYMEKVKEDPHAVPCFGGLFCIEIGQPY